MLPRISRDLVVRGVGVILRVPSLFIAEAWHRTDPGMIKSHYVESTGRQVNSNLEVIFTFVYYAALLFAFVVALLPLKRLVTFYMYILSTGLLAVCHLVSWNYTETEKNGPQAHVSNVLDERECVYRLAFHLAFQGVMSAVIGYLVGLRGTGRFCLLGYTVPLLARLAGYPAVDLHRVHNAAWIFTLLLVIFFIFNQVPHILDLLNAAFRQVSATVQVYGWMSFLATVWYRIFLPAQFLIFWLSLFAMQLHKYAWHVNGKPHPVLSEGPLVILLATIGECCVTPVSLIGVCVTVSFTAHLILTITKLYLQGSDAWLNDSVMHHGWTEGFTMFLLALQTGLIDLKATQRAFLMSIVLFIVISSLIQSMYEITEPLLLGLGASQSKCIFSHVRAILLASFLWMFPLYMTHAICQVFELDFWLLAVISSCVLTSVQVLGTLVVYALFIYDGLREEPWPALDDVVYYAKSTTRVLEFLVALFFVGYGIRESVVGEWSWVNSSIQIIHCYFNVWHRLQAGWQSYLLRRDAVSKIAGLPEATQEQLQQHNDVCAICFQNMASARITPCRHYFHAMCLRKWLYVQANCPMCHSKISKPDLPASPADEQQAEEENGLGDLMDLIGPDQRQQAEDVPRHRNVHRPGWQHHGNHGDVLGRQGEAGGQSTDSADTAPTRAHYDRACKHGSDDAATQGAEETGIAGSRQPVTEAGKAGSKHRVKGDDEARQGADGAQDNVVLANDDDDDDDGRLSRCSNLLPDCVLDTVSAEQS